MKAVHPAMLQYRAVLAAAEQMLDYARHNDWNEVSRTAGTIGAMNGRLRGFEPTSLTCPQDRNERLRILTRLIVIDAEVRQRKDPMAARLDSLLSPAGRQQSPCPVDSFSVGAQ
tara:strand:+ start:198 stop:539 length:342 start_codon:yes stop_codon:yes gene_type:complete